MKKNWSMSSADFQRFLEWIDEGVNSDGEKYLEMRRKLVDYFDRKNCLAPDDLADETLNRVARRLSEEGEIITENPAKYCYITARFVFLESLRDKAKQNVPIDDVQTDEISVKEDTDEQELKEKMLSCLEKCISQMEAAGREMIVKYYYGTERVKIENRRKIAEKPGISANALTIRACRIRAKLEICVKNCRESENC